MIRNRVEGAPVGPVPSFPLSGDISYDPRGITPASGQSIAFHRASGVTWHMNAPAVADYRLESAACNSSTGASSSAASGSMLSVALAPGDTVHCTYVREWTPPRHVSLRLVQITKGGTGRFRYIVGPYDDDPTLVWATSRHPGVPVTAGPERNLALLSSNRYVISVLPPAHPLSHWTVSGECNGRHLKLYHVPFSNVRFRLVFGHNLVCTVTSRLTHTGSIRLSSVTEGGIGAADFVIDSLGPAPWQLHQHVTTAHEGVAAVASPDLPSDATSHLDRGRYLVTEQAPLEAPARTNWKLTSVTCNQRPVPVRQGGIIVTLSRRTRRLSCEFATRLTGGRSPNAPAAHRAVTLRRTRRRSLWR